MATVNLFIEITKSYARAHNKDGFDNNKNISSKRIEKMEKATNGK